MCVIIKHSVDGDNNTLQINRYEDRETHGLGASKNHHPLLYTSRTRTQQIE